MLLMPSRFEPCGLTQIYAMRYGTLPVVHATGGLNDTVVDREDVASSSGFVTEELSVDALVELIEEAMTSFRSYRSWRPQMVHAMEQDFSWKTSASQYEELYADSLGIELVEDAPEEAGEEQETPDEEAGEEQETPDEEASDEQGEGDDSDDDAQQAG
jgi:starch synthase